MMNLSPQEISELCASHVLGCRLTGEVRRYEATASEIALALGENDAFVVADQPVRTRATYLKGILTQEGWEIRKGSGISQLADGSWKNGQREWLQPPIDLVPADHQDAEVARRSKAADALARRRESRESNQS